VPHPIRALVGLLVFVALRASAVSAEITAHLSDTQGRPLEDAVVSLVPLDRPAPPIAKPPEIPEIVQSHRQFSPYVTAIPVGTTVAFPNKDDVDHYLYSKSATKSFRFPLYAPNKSERITFDKAGIVPIGCDIHDKMIAYVVVLDTPWYGQTSANGTTTIRDVPAGKYRLSIWHPRLREADEMEINLGPADAKIPINRSFALQRDPRARGPLEGARKGY
jgi:hypothetical protein